VSVSRAASLGNHPHNIDCRSHKPDNGDYECNTAQAGGMFNGVMGKVVHIPLVYSTSARQNTCPLSDSAKTHVKSVSKTMPGLVRDGCISIKKKYITIHDMDKLKALLADRGPA